MIGKMFKVFNNKKSFNCHLSGLRKNEFIINTTKKWLKLILTRLKKSSAQDADPLDPQDFGFLAPDPQKYADPRIRIQGVKNQPKTAKKKFTPKTQLSTEKKRDYKNFLICKWFIKFQDKNKLKK